MERAGRRPLHDGPKTIQLGSRQANTTEELTMRNIFLAAVLSLAAIGGCSTSADTADGASTADLVTDALPDESDFASGDQTDVIDLDETTQTDVETSTDEEIKQHPCEEEEAIPGPCAESLLSDGGLFSSFKFIYEDGLLQRRNQYDGSDSLTFYSLYFYADGLVEYTEFYEAPGTLISTATYEHEDGLVVRIEAVSELDGSIHITTYEYDENGNQVVEAEDYDGDGEGDVFTRTEYDDDGNRTSFIWENTGEGGATTVTTFTYDDKGQLIGGTWDYDVAGSGTLEAVNNDAGQSLQIRLVREDGSLFLSIDFKYDAIGNITSEMTTQYDDAGDPVSIIEYVTDYSCWPCFQG
jgi:antitoxin component YwqK of YwqJK toxin-antitoxin module